MPASRNFTALLAARGLSARRLGWCVILVIVASGPLALAAQAPQPGIPRTASTDSLNLGFEVPSTINPLAPAAWYTGGQGYDIRLDTVAPFAGRRSLRITGPATPDPRAFGVASRSIPLPRGAGRMVRLRGYIRTQDIGQGYAGLWLRTDGEGGRMLALENMSGRAIAGTWPWTAFEISLPLDSAAVSVAFGVLHPGDRSAWFDSLSIDIDGRSLSDRAPALSPRAVQQASVLRHAIPTFRATMPGARFGQSDVTRD